MQKAKIASKKSKHDQKVGQVMHQFKTGDLHFGKSNLIVTNPKQAIAIALSKAENITKLKQ